MGFVGAEFTGGTVHFFGAKFTGGTVHFRSARFTGGTVGFRGAEFTGGTVHFFGAEFAGGTVDFSRVREWSHPPDFDLWDTPPPGLLLPQRPAEAKDPKETRTP